MKLVFSGIMIPVSTVDWYGRSASVVFFNGCNFKCLYCSNNRFIEVSNRLEPLFKGGAAVDIEELENHILHAKSFISAVVFSGGEPTTQYDALEYLSKFAKKQGLMVGIETNGYYPERLSRLIQQKLLDKIFLDIKAPPGDSHKYSVISGGKEDAAERVLQSLNLKGVALEARTTVFRSIDGVSEIAKFLADKDCTYVLQQGIPENAPDERIRKEKPLSREELIDLARSVNFLTDVRIRTKEKGEEKII